MTEIGHVQLNLFYDLVVNELQLSFQNILFNILIFLHSVKLKLKYIDGLIVGLIDKMLTAFF